MQNEGEPVILDLTGDTDMNLWFEPSNSATSNTEILDVERSKGIDI